MACRAILRCISLPVAIETLTHRKNHCAFCHRRLRHVSMARCAAYVRPVMRRVAKQHVRIRRKAVDALPRDLLLLISVFNHLLHFWFFPCQLRMAQHAFGDRRNPGGRPNIGAGVAVDALQAQFHVNVVRKRDWLPRGSCQRAESNQPNGFAIENSNQAEPQTDSLSQTVMRVPSNLVNVKPWKSSL